MQARKVSRFVVASAVAVTGALFSAASASAEVVYDSLPNPAPGNVPSLGYQATSTDEFGDQITLGGTFRDLTTVTVGLSSWALKSDYPSVGDLDSYSHSLTLNLYNVDNTGANPEVGGLIGTQTITADILYRPEVYGFNGIYFTVDFDLTADGITLPENFIVALEYNTQTHGNSPIGTAGPYNSLNYGLSTTGASVGSDFDGDALFWDTSSAGNYTDAGAGGLDFLRRDTAWSPYTPTVQINAVPEPTSIALLGLAGVALIGRRRKA